MSNTKFTSVTFGGMNQDLSTGKFPKELYYEARNMKLNPVEGQTAGNISNSYGNTLAITIPVIEINKTSKVITYGDSTLEYSNLEIDSIPTISGTQSILSMVNTRNGAIIFSTDDNGADCIWEITDLDSKALDLKLLYLRDMGFSTDNPIQAIFNYENELLQKVYWVDGKNFLRYFNKEQSIDNGFDTNLIDNNLATINSRGEFTLRKPTVERSSGGGLHTAGMIQYGYTLYNLNGSETVLSPLSDLHPLDKGEDRGGGELNEQVGAMSVVVVEDVDPDFKYIRLYSAKYTTFNGVPEVKMIYDGQIGNYSRFTFTDTGNTNLGSLSLAQLAFLGADPIIPEHIAVKDNILFASNNKSTAYKFDIDTRAYSYNSARSLARIYDNVYYTGAGDIPYHGDITDITTSFDNIPTEHDAVNLDFDTFRYRGGTSTTSPTALVDSATYAININHPGGLPSQFNYPAPLTAQNGEATIIGGKYISDYAGTLAIDLISRIDKKNSLIPTAEDNNLFFIEIKKNGSMVSSFHPVLTEPTWNIDNFYRTIDVEVGDVVEVNIRYNYIWAEFEIDGPSFNIDFTGELTLAEVVSAGSNNEGGSGKYIDYELTRSNNLEIDSNTTTNRFFKDNEIYRISIMFYNSKGQHTEAKWIADFKAPEGNLTGQYNTLKVYLNQAFTDYIATLPEEDRPVSYSILRAIRKDTDKTILAQGMLTGMFVQTYSDEWEKYDTISKRVEYNNDLVKLPIPMTRGYRNGTYKNNSYFPLYTTRHGETMNEYSRDVTTSDERTALQVDPRGYAYREIYTHRSDYKFQQTWQYTKLFQLQAPELAFNKNIIVSDVDELRILGTVKRNECVIWDSPYDLDKFTAHSTKGSKNSFDDGAPAEFEILTDEASGYGVIGPSHRGWINGGEENYNMMRRFHIYKNFNPLIKSNTDIVQEIYGKPEISSIGHAGKYYNGDRDLRYMNKLTTVISDRARDENNDHDSSATRKITSVVSEGVRSMTLALGDHTLDAEQRPSLEELHTLTGTQDWDTELIAEVIKPKSFIYSGAIYNGYTYEARNRTEYIQIGEVKEVTNPTVFIKSPGDTFVQQFKCTRLAKTPGNSYDIRTESFVDTIEYITETTINLNERNDDSWQGWDNSVEPTFEEANKYNDVYSTDAQAITYFSDDSRIKDISQRETEIIASKTKIPGEFVENWVDFKPDEVQYLDGKYGPINALITYRDELYAFQDTAFAFVAVNPRVQVQGQDGIDIELGSGNILHDYKYISTDSGSVNKWGVLPTPTGIYYVDIINKLIQRFKGTLEGLSEAKGIHSTLVNKMSRESLKTDNPLIGQGISMGMDVPNGDVYTSMLQTEEDDTLGFNYKVDRFSSFYDFIPTTYLTKGDKVFTVPLDKVTRKSGNTVWEHGTDNYQEFYNTKYEGYVTLLITGENPAAEKVFNNIEFNSEVTLNKQDVADVTVDSITAWNSYQESDKVTLTIDENLKRRFRTWRANIPREGSTRNRLRDKWLYLKIGTNPTNNYKLILHDVIIKYI